METPEPITIEDLNYNIKELREYLSKFMEEQSKINKVLLDIINSNGLAVK